MHSPAASPAPPRRPYECLDVRSPHERWFNRFIGFPYVRSDNAVMAGRLNRRPASSGRTAICRLQQWTHPHAERTRRRESPQYGLEMSEDRASRSGCLGPTLSGVRHVASRKEGRQNLKTRAHEDDATTRDLAPHDSRRTHSARGRHDVTKTTKNPAFPAPRRAQHTKQQSTRGSRRPATRRVHTRFRLRGLLTSDEIRYRAVLRRKGGALRRGAAGLYGRPGARAGAYTVASGDVHVRARAACRLPLLASCAQPRRGPRVRTRTNLRQYI